MNKSSSEMGFSSSTCDNHLCPSKRCPSCGHNLQSNLDWLGFPAGVKFDPSDQELIEHLQAKVGEASKHSKSHPLIDEFITSIEGEDGICYTHPQTLPGVRRDGVSRHFFHRPSKAYTTGTRKRRKIQKERDLHGGGGGGETRWHKTGKTRPVMVNGEQRGCKKILVLYTNYGKNRKPGKTNWVMHQYHLGQLEQEREGELVVSKIFYQTQPRQSTVPAAAAAGIQNRPLLDGGGGSCSSLETIISHQRDDFSDYIQLKDDDCSLLPFSRTILDEGGNIEETSIAREDRAADSTCQVGDVAHDHLSNQIAAPFHISSISSLMSPFHRNSINYVPSPNQDFQEQQHHHKLGASSGLEDLIMSCTSTNTKEETSIPPNPQEADWSKYSTFWPEPIGNSDHHGI